MTLQSFKSSLDSAHPPKRLDTCLTALWHEAKGNWDKAHRTVQDDESSHAAWVHAHLHRKEGDHSNARYWYSRAGHDTSGLSPDEEWNHIVKALLDEF